MSRFIFTLFFTGILAMAGSVMAQDNDGITLEILAEVFQQEVDENGQTRIKRVPAEKVVPGDDVIYTIEYINLGSDSADKVVITNPIPEHMIYEAGSAHAANTITRFSIDDGQNYRDPDELWIVDGDGARRLAKASDYTHIQWTLMDPLMPTELGRVAYRARLE